MMSNDDSGESLLQMEIRKCQQAFAMGSNDEPEEFEDIQFFRRIPSALGLKNSINNSNVLLDGGGGYINQGSEIHNNSSEAIVSSSDYIGNGEVFEWGEPQFFPGNTLGYLETILEETDEEVNGGDDEDCSSVRHWWNNDSDTDTDSVIVTSNNNQIQQTSIQEFLNHPSSTTIRSHSTSSPPPNQHSYSGGYDVDSLYLFDTLDLALEENLMKPRRRTGIAYQSDIIINPMISNENKLLEEVMYQHEEGKEEEMVASPVDDGPPVVNEEDFFCSSSSDSSCSGEEESSERECDDEINSRVLAEFNLCPENVGGGDDIWKGARNNVSRHSYPSSKIRSFRSFDSLNNLGDSGLIFTNAETFPTFPQETEEINENCSSPTGEEEDDRNTKISRKNSSEASSEDSGIHELNQQKIINKTVEIMNEEEENEDEESLNFTELNNVIRSVFALNPFLYSSASEDTSIITTQPSSIDQSILSSSSNPLPTIPSMLEMNYPRTSRSGSPPKNSDIEDELSNLISKGGNESVNIMITKGLEQEGVVDDDEVTTEEEPRVVPIESGTIFNSSEYGGVDEVEETERVETIEITTRKNLQLEKYNQEEEDEVWNKFCLEVEEHTSFNPLPNPKESQEEPFLSFENSILSECIIGAVPNFGSYGTTETIRTTEENLNSDRILNSERKEEEVLSDTVDKMEYKNDVVPIKTYGGSSNSDVEVYIVSEQGQYSPRDRSSPNGVGGGDDNQSIGSNVKQKSVHFCPVVSEISWRESYAEQSSNEDIDSSPQHFHKHEIEDNDNPIEKVHVQCQILNESPVLLPKLTERERLMALEPQASSPPPVRILSTMPDLLSQVQNNKSEGSTDSPASTIQQQQQHQIFPSMFVANTSGKENKRNGKKSYSPQPIVPNTTNNPVRKELTKVVEVPISKNLTKGKKEKDTSKSKPGFFQRLTKIRLSGGSSNKGPKRIYPKEVTPPTTTSDEKDKSESNGYKNVSSPPLLKLESKNKEDELIDINNKKRDEVDAECSEAFDNILEEIAGLNTILQRQGFNQQDSSSSNQKNKRSFAERKQFLRNNTETVSGGFGSSTLDTKLNQFKEDTRSELSKSHHPNIDEIEGVTRYNQEEGRVRSMIDESSRHNESFKNQLSKSNEREWYRLLRSAAEKYTNTGSRIKKRGIVETDLDTGKSHELLDGEFDIENEGPPPLPSSLPPPSSAKAQSLTNLNTGLKLSIPPETIGGDEGEERAKSLEFLLDEESKPPENGLQEREHRKLSEHELRIQRSLQKIDIPQWYKQNNRLHPHPHDDLRKDSPLLSTSSSSSQKLKLYKDNRNENGGGLAGGWAGLSAYRRTPSLSSLQNNNTSFNIGGSLNRANFVRGRPSTMSGIVTRSSRESLLSPNSTASQSPSAFERSSFTYGMPLTLTRFNKYNSGEASPSSIVSNASLLSSSGIKKPYLGWRSTERLAGIQPSENGYKLSTYKTPHERLAEDLLLTRHKNPPIKPTGPHRPPIPPKQSSQQPQQSPPTWPTSPPSSPSVHESIKEITLAINNLVNRGSKSPSPPKTIPRNKKQKLWFESSFVGKSMNQSNYKSTE